MKTMLRRTSFPVWNVTFQNGATANNIRGTEAQTLVIGHDVVLSMNLACNEPRVKTTTNSGDDTRRLLEHFERIRFVQFRREPWLEDGLRSAARQAAQPAQLSIEFAFKNGAVKRAAVRYEKTEFGLWMYVRTTPKTTPDETASG